MTITPTKEERKQWKENLYNSLNLISDYHDDLAKKKRDSLKTLKTNYFYWADTFNGKYFPEMKNANTDKYCAWLVQEYKKY